MKKLILSLIVLLAAALVFTGCDLPGTGEDPVPTPEPASPETLNLEGTWLFVITANADEENPESPTYEMISMKLEITSTTFAIYQVTDTCAGEQMIFGAITAGLTPEELEALVAMNPQLAEDIEIVWEDTPFLAGAYSVSGSTPSFTINGAALPITLSADKTSITLHSEDALTGEPEDKVFVKE